MKLIPLTVERVRDLKSEERLEIFNNDGSPRLGCPLLPPYTISPDGTRVGGWISVRSSCHTTSIDLTTGFVKAPPKNIYIYQYRKTKTQKLIGRDSPFFNHEFDLETYIYVGFVEIEND